MATPWDHAAKAFRGDLAAAVPTETVRRLHRLRPALHALVALRQVALLTLGVLAVLRWGEHGWVWVPASALIGFAIFSFTVLLHEVVHGVVSGSRSAWPERILAHVYAIPSGLSQAQFTRWHLDHHDHLGSTQHDPKRAFLSPKRGSRLEKLLYLTPALFPIYFRAARRAMARYPAALRRRIAVERVLAIGFHLGIAALLVTQLGWGPALKLHLVPVFVVFPIAFTINRLGQHYDVDPDDPAKWGTLMRPSPLLWDILFVNSSYHLEHHYFPRVPCYHLPELHRALQPFYRARGIEARRFGGLLVDWFVRNRTPHTQWRQPAPPTPPQAEPTPTHG